MAMRRTAFIAVLMLAASTHAAPYRPADDAVVLERLQVAGGERLALKRLRAEAGANPDRLQPALALARRYIALGRAEADPRHFAHAEALLAPWLQRGAAPPEALVLRATVLQNRHDFDGAVADLRAALQRRPSMSQAWLTLAAVQEAQGDYAGALRSCLALSRTAAALLAAVCAESASSLSGRAAEAYRALEALAARPSFDAESARWLIGILAELAERLGNAVDAEKWYRAALRQGPADVYLKVAYADFLLARGRPADAKALLAEDARSDPLLLRLALAERPSGDAAFGAHADTLRARFAAARARGDATHQGDEARFLLEIEHQPERALALAERNWQVQREPRDALILLQAALAAGKPEAAVPVRDFVRQRGLEDVRLQALLDKIG